MKLLITIYIFSISIIFGQGFSMDEVEEAVGGIEQHDLENGFVKIDDYYLNYGFANLSKTPYEPFSNIVIKSNGIENRIVVYESSQEDKNPYPHDYGVEPKNLAYKISDHSNLLIFSHVDKNGPSTENLVKVDLDFNIQKQLNMYHKQDGVLTYHDIKKLSDSTFIVCGPIAYSKQANCGINITILDTNLNIINSKNYFIGEFLDPSFETAIRISDDGYEVWFIDKYIGQSNEPPRSINCLQTDKNLRLVEHKRMKLNELYYYYEFLEFGNNFLLQVTGNQETYYLFNLSNGLSNLTLQELTFSSRVKENYQFFLKNNNELLKIINDTKETNGKDRTKVLVLNNDLKNVELRNYYSDFNSIFFIEDQSIPTLTKKQNDKSVFFPLTELNCDYDVLDPTPFFEINEIEFGGEIISNEVTTTDSISYNYDMFIEKIMDKTINGDYFNCEIPFETDCETVFEMSNSTEFETIWDASFEENKLVLTDSISENGGAVKYSNPIDLTEPFTTEFEFSISGGYNDFKDGSLPGADGIVLLFGADEKSVKKVNRKKYGGHLFYSEINNALALEIDTYNNFLLGDPDGNHLAIQASKEAITANHEALTPLAITSDIPTILNDGSETYRCKMEFDGEKLEVTLSRTGENLEPQIILEDFEFSDHINPIQDKFAYIYLMSSTGTSYARHEINSWKLCSDSDAEFVSSVDFSENDDLIYPNPASEIINFSTSGKKQIRIIDLQGSEYYSNEITNNSLDISFLSKGMYFCIVNGDTYAKFIKE